MSDGKKNYPPENSRIFPGALQDRTRCSRIAGKFEEIILQFYGEENFIKDLCKKQIRKFNGFIAEYRKAQKENRYYPNPIKWRVQKDEDTICCYYTTLVLIYDIVNDPQEEFSEGLDTKAAGIIHNYVCKISNNYPYDDNGIAKALRCVEADIRYNIEKREKVKSNSEQKMPKHPISLEVAVSQFEVSRSTLMRDIKSGKLKSYRPEKHSKSEPHILDAVEVGGIHRLRKT